ncbi:helix-turn-helix domain-containing protein, partial [Tenacibaculum xiamenense]|uniref:helix-turn-helix domain-containing protein n=1 Tax=Tenacibaculum xiamenense TaxID=1261553 RepID=UPI0038B68547
YLKALKEKDTMKMLDGKYYLADIKNDDDLYLKFCDSLISIYRKNPNKTFPVSIYIDKSHFYFQKARYSLALKELTEAEKALKKIKNDSLQNLLYAWLGLIKDHNKDYKKSLYFFKKAYNFAKRKNYLKDNYIFLSLPANISDEYNNINQLDSAHKYINEAKETYTEHKENAFLGLALFIKGKIEIKEREYSIAIESLQKSIPYFIDDENYRVLIMVYIKIAQCYEKINHYQLSKTYHLKSDSLYELKKIKNRSLKHTFSFLVNHYKKEHNLEKQLHYINKLMDLKEFRFTEKSKIQQTFTNEFDIPKLLEERKRIVEELEAKSRKNQFVFISLLAISIGFIFYQVRKNRIQRKRFEALLYKQKKGNESLINTQVQGSRPKLELSENIITNILKRLEKFEDNNEFVNVNLNLQNLASQFETNASYLSKVVNHYKQASFSNYINQLRIEYCVEQLKHNELWRKYTIKAIANEVGFNKAESFSKAFYKYTELRPSYFIKELKKTQTTNISNE